MRAGRLPGVFNPTVGQLRGDCTCVAVRVGLMETAPKPGSDVPPKKDRLQAKRKVETSLG